MRNSIIEPEFSPFIFWDTDPSEINWEKSFRYVIARVIEYGAVTDWKKLKEYYGLEKIKEVMLNERTVDSRVLSFVSCVLEVPKESFRCYKERQSRPPHWNF